MESPLPGAGSATVAAEYVVGCPDVLAITVMGHPELTGRKAIGPEGRIDLGPLGRLRVEGQPVSGVAREVAEAAGVPPAAVHVQVAEYNSRQIYLFGEGVNRQQAIPYRGPETVLDVLQRVGGITAGAAPNDIFVVRSRVIEGRPPEVFHINLREIVLHQDQRTNIRLEPFDQIHVGETRQASFHKCVPPCLRPIYEKICGLNRPGHPRLEFRSCPSAGHSLYLRP